MRRFTFAIIFLCTIFIGAQALVAEQGEKSKSPEIKPRRTDIVVSGKLFCGVERKVTMPFDGIVTSLSVQPGQAVKKGQVLVRFRLKPEAALALHRRVSSFRIRDLEMRLAELKKKLLELEDQEKETKELMRHNMAPAKSLEQIQREMELLSKERDDVRERLPLERALAEEDRAVVGKLLGYPVRHGQVPSKGVLMAPIKGHVIWVNPALRDGAEFKAHASLMRIGVMDPILIRARVHEIEAVQLKVGDEAEFTTEAIPGKRYKATVTRISWASLTPQLERPSYYMVELSISNPDFVLREGLRGMVTFRKKNQ